MLCVSAFNVVTLKRSESRTTRRLEALVRWELAHLRPRHVRAEFRCTEATAAFALAGAYLRAYWRSAKHCSERSLRLLSQEHNFLDAITRVIERESFQRSSGGFLDAVSEIAEGFDALAMYSADFVAYAARLLQVLAPPKTEELGLPKTW